MYRKYMAAAAAVLVSVSMMMTGCNGNHAVTDNNGHQTEAVNTRSEDSTRSGTGSKTGTKQGTQKEGNTTGSAAQKRENQKTGSGSGNTKNENTNVNNINITNGNGNGNGGRKGSNGGTGSGKTSTSTTKNVYNIYETHNHNTTNKTENHYSATNNTRTENKYSNSTTEYVNDDHSIGKTNVRQEQNIEETNNIDITHENYNYGDQSVGSGNDQESDPDVYDYGKTDRYAAGGAGEGSTADPSNDEDQDDTLPGFGYPGPAEDGSDTTDEGTTEDYPYPSEGTDIGGDEDLPNDNYPVSFGGPEEERTVYNDDGYAEEDPEYIDDQPVEEDPGYTDDEPGEEDSGYTDDDWADDGGSDDQGDDSASIGQYMDPQMEETADNWEFLDNGSAESVDVLSDSGSMQVSSDGAGSEPIDVSGYSAISFMVSMEDGSEVTGWIEVCDQDGNVIGQTGQIDAGSSTNASFGVSGTDTVQFRACTDSGETVNLQISSLEMN